MTQDIKIFEERIKLFFGEPNITVNGICYTYVIKGPCFENHEVGGAEFIPATPADVAADAALDINAQSQAILEEMNKKHLIRAFTNFIFREDLSTSKTKFFQNKLD